MSENERVLTDVFEQESLEGVLAIIMELLPNKVVGDIFDPLGGRDLEEPREDEEFAFEMDLPMKLAFLLMHNATNKIESIVNLQKNLDCCVECARREGILKDQDMADIKNIGFYLSMGSFMKSLFDHHVEKKFKEFEWYGEFSKRNMIKFAFRADFKVYYKAIPIEDLQSQGFLMIVPEKDSDSILSDLFGQSDVDLPGTSDDSFEEMIKKAGIDLPPGTKFGKA